MNFSGSAGGWVGCGSAGGWVGWGAWVGVAAGWQADTNNVSNKTKLSTNQMRLDFIFSSIVQLKTGHLETVDWGISGKLKSC
jgi:hypothetical protein